MVRMSWVVLACHRCNVLEGGSFFSNRACHWSWRTLGNVTGTSSIVYNAWYAWWGLAAAAASAPIAFSGGLGGAVCMYMYVHCNSLTILKSICSLTWYICLS